MSSPAPVVKERSLSPFFDDPFFQQFFGGGNPAKERVQNSLGSGVIVRPDGLVVTNNHVIAKADEIRVVLSDGREFPAEVIAADEKFDIGILKIDTKGEALPTLSLKDSDDINVGDLVLAIGNPFGVGQTVTMGIVSALARTKYRRRRLRLLHPDRCGDQSGKFRRRAIGTDGKLIGINTAIYSKTGAASASGFADPVPTWWRVSSMPRPPAASWCSPGSASSGEALTADIAVSNASAASGRRGGPAGLSEGSGRPERGVQPGDVIVGVNDRNIGDPGGLRSGWATQKDGRPNRLAQRQSAAASGRSAGEADRGPRSAEPRRDRAQGRAAAERRRGGQSLAGGQRRARSSATGRVSRSQDPRGSYPDKLGLEPGDLLIKINGKDVYSVDDRGGRGRARRRMGA
jgi:serine protease Do